MPRHSAANEGNIFSEVDTRPHRNQRETLSAIPPCLMFFSRTPMRPPNPVPSSLFSLFYFIFGFFDPFSRQLALLLCLPGPFWLHLWTVKSERSCNTSISPTPRLVAGGPIQGAERIGSKRPSRRRCSVLNSGREHRMNERCFTLNPMMPQMLSQGFIVGP